MTAVLQQVSDALATTVATVSPGIVRVEARRRLPASGLVWSRDGIIVTTHHVIEQDDNIRVGLHSGQTVAATLVGRDATTDLAVLRAAHAELEPPAWAEAETLGVGHLASCGDRASDSADAIGPPYDAHRPVRWPPEGWMVGLAQRSGGSADSERPRLGE